MANTSILLSAIIVVAVALCSPLVAAEVKVCRADKQQALYQAVRFYDDSLDLLEAARSVQKNTFDRFSVLGQPANITFYRYVRRDADDALIMYALDDAYLCAFLFTAKTGPSNFEYARVRMGRKRFDELLSLLRLEILPVQVAANRNPRKRGTGQAFAHVEDRKFTRGAFRVHDVNQPKTAGDSAAARLSEAMFHESFEPHLRSVRTLSIIPVRGMSAMPISVLRPFGGETAVIDHFSVNFIVFAVDVDKKVGWVPGYAAPLIIGDPDGSNDPDYEFVPLKGALEEAKIAHRRFGGHLVTGADATSAALFDHGRNAELVYIAAHGLSSSEQPMMGSFLRLADKRVTAHEIMVGEPKAPDELVSRWIYQPRKWLQKYPVVVLSACQTGTGKELDAGVVGLARAFHIAGASNTIMSLWSIDDTATLAMMTRLIEAMQSHTPAEALRLAMIAARGSNSLPYQWASFNVFGNALVRAVP